MCSKAKGFDGLRTGDGKKGILRVTQNKSTWFQADNQLA